jgi:hypothetical protein
MTPQEKARELLDRFIQANGNSFFAKECALLAIEEILKAIDWHEFEQPNKEYEYWNEVKQEIEKL